MNIYYVYAYLRSTDSPNGHAGSPYYIGRGRGNRIYADHSMCGGKTPKDKRFALKIFENCSSVDAKKLEIALIKIFGRIDLKTGCLRNLTDGGEGTTGLLVSVETRKKQSEAKHGRVPWNKGKTGVYSQECIRKMSLSHKGKRLSPQTEIKKGERRSPNTEFKKGMESPFKGIKRPGTGPKTKFTKGMVSLRKGKKFPKS